MQFSMMLVCCSVVMSVSVLAVIASVTESVGLSS
jgi:hypothetical protein